MIAGSAKGRRLVAPPGATTRPTSDRVREALFSSLQDRLPEARVADLYAGSGALGIEALSRGAVSTTFVEHERRALDALRRNLATTGFEGRSTVVTRDVTSVVGALPGGPFDLALLDPPYGLDAAALGTVLERLRGDLVRGALIVVERATRQGELAWPPGVLLERTRRYGDTTLHVGVVVPRGDGRNDR